MEPQKSQTEGTFGTFLDMLRVKTKGGSGAMEDKIVNLLSIIVGAKGSLRVDELYERCGLYQGEFGEVLEVMLGQGMIQIDSDNRVQLSPELKKRL